MNGSASREWPQGGFMKPFQERVVAEKAELDDKIAKLIAFRDSPTFNTLDPNEQSRLTDQQVTMQQYSRILGERIAAFQ